MFHKVLVANRGEIAVRVMRACEELGVGTVAVYSDADKHAGHVRYADEAYNVGPTDPSESYLDQAAIVEAARKAGADAIHPGYGFLAENASFARRVEDSEITWVGPSADAMERLGEKARARRVMRDADVPIVPGTTDPVEDPEEVLEFGDEHGYPLAIKAEGGGGGRGIKIVEGPDEVEEQLESAKREGEAYFSNDSVYLERFLDSSRHIEIQILADEHGTVRHLGERDCSLQRRRQKVIEEAPSPALTEGLREQIREAARRGADAADYYNAGTFEFLVEDEDRGEDGLLGEDADFYFMEVNTRIQVEHTVTEELTGIDIVKWQLRVAAGEELTVPQEAVELSGHAMEFRVNAENPAAEFAPTAGPLDSYAPPGGVGVRMDDAVREGDEITGDYDSMFAKVIVHAGDRTECIARSERALREFEIEGLHTVLPFHRLMLTDEAFVAGEHTTRYLDEELDPERIADAVEKWGPEETGSGGDDGEAVEREFTVEVNGRRFAVELEEHGASLPDLEGLDGGADSGSGPGPGPGSRSGPQAAPGADESAADPDTSGAGNTVTAEMQGTVLSVDVEEGEEVAAGDVVLVLEAMKMENDITTDAGGTVAEIAVAEGDSVDMGDVLVVVE